MTRDKAKTPKEGTNWMPPIQGTPKEYDPNTSNTFSLEKHRKPLLRPWFYNLGFIFFGFFTLLLNFEAEVRYSLSQNETFSQ